ncbi:hypothetical protein DAERI_010040 [Deinococcus aerius]|uniref:ATP-binding protein n=1 Tax=Deinococcus aerius TaxID=200253 RepID=A0A2I9DD73_9DEIO|nr:hypothetical protein [Deinococcus aerius]GBF03868.1 hypothetical protein DAERI_010040 [Deinococcus aerius]
MTQPFEPLGLKYNPFEAAGSGPPLSGAEFLFEAWEERLTHVVNLAGLMSGPKAYALIGEYGSGKSYVLQWLADVAFTQRRIKPFVFDNPGVEFYKLANDLLNKIGREEFSKALWEYLRTVSRGYQPDLGISSNPFRSWLQHTKKQKKQDEEVHKLAEAIRADGITDREEIAHRLGMMIVQTVDKPYFEYRDFVAGKNSLVAENEEAPYMAALIRCVMRTQNAEGVAFLIDEFEEISLQNTLTRKQAYEYLSTLKRLMNVTGQENHLWIVVSMTPQAEEITRQLEPAFWSRFIHGGTNMFRIEPLTDEQGYRLIHNRLVKARVAGFEAPNPLYPFPEEFLAFVREDVKSSPRSLVKLCSSLISQGILGGVTPPYTEPFVKALAFDLQASEVVPE